ncbi:MAG: hypothetical protein ACKVII_06595 [Planctomycetales bacterium]
MAESARQLKAGGSCRLHSGLPLVVLSWLRMLAQSREDAKFPALSLGGFAWHIGIEPTEDGSHI